MDASKSGFDRAVRSADEPAPAVIDANGSSEHGLRWRRYAAVLALTWTVVVGGSLAWNTYLVKLQATERARVEARGSSDKDLLIQQWIAGHGGVYVPATERTPPNPNLSEVPERDIVTPSGRKLTLMNAACVMRHLYEGRTEPGGLRGHFTSLKPIRPANFPDPWEARSLRAFDRAEIEISAVMEMDGEPYMRLMRPMATTETCLKCHAEQGYKVGDIRGGFSVSVPMAGYYGQARSQMIPLVLGHGVIWVLGVAGIGVGAGMIRSRISERERAEAGRRRSEERLRSVVANVPGAVYRSKVEPPWLIEHVSDGMLPLTGYGPRDFVTGRRAYADIIVPDDVEKVAEAIEAGVAGRGPFVLEYRIRRADGSIRWVYEKGRAAYDRQGKPLWLDGVILDITDRKEAEQERQHLQAQMQYAQKLESLGVLAGGIAHDFNNLLMVVQGNADLALLDTPLTSSVYQDLQEIKGASQRAAGLAEQMLAYSGKGQFVVEPTDVSEVIRDTCRMLEVLISKKATLHLDLGDSVPPVMADATQVRQVVMNLLTNASEAIGDQPGTISISVEARRVDREHPARTYFGEDVPEGLYVALEVSDTGCGMDPDTLGKVFDPFFTTKFTGRGLGMAAVLGIVRGHHGAIMIDSPLGRGTTVKVLFPVTKAQQPQAPAAIEPPEGGLAAGTVLLVDDEESVRAIGRAMLERLGMTVITAADGRQALELFRERAEGIDCVILDLTMPRMDGRETFRELRRIRADAQVIMSSGYHDQEVMQQLAAEGSAGFVPKPYELAELRRALRPVLGG